MSFKPVRVDKGFSGRSYPIEGEEFPSVTTIIDGGTAKPFLVGWAATKERDMVLRAAYATYHEACSGGMDAKKFQTAVLKSLGYERAHTKELGRAADVGTAVHRAIERELRSELGMPEATLGKKITLSTEQRAAAKLAFGEYHRWKFESHFKPMYIEQVVYSKKYKYAGTMDIMGTANLQNTAIFTNRFVGDWKTSAGIYFGAHLQVAAYRHAWLEMGNNKNADGSDTLPLDGCILRLPKTPEDPTFEARLIPEEEMERNFQTFLNVMEVWKATQRHEREYPWKRKKGGVGDKKSDVKKSGQRKVRETPEVAD